MGRQVIQMKLDVDTSDVSPAPFPISSLWLTPQSNGVIRLHASNGGYICSIARNAEDGQLYVFEKGFGVNNKPVQITKQGNVIQPKDSNHGKTQTE